MGAHRVRKGRKRNGHTTKDTALAAGAEGFVNYVLHPSTWGTADTCYLEDLFVSPEARGSGAGRALIEAVLERAKAYGWDKVYWHTRADNARARALYDSFAPADDFVRYVVPPD